MRIPEAFIGISQVEVSVNVQDPIFSFTGEVMMITQRYAMVTANHSYYLASLFPPVDAVCKPCSHILVGTPDAIVHFAVLWLFLNINTFLKRFDDCTGVFSQTGMKHFEMLGELVHPDTFLPKLRKIVMMQVDLH